MVELCKRLSSAISNSNLSYAELEKRTNIPKSSIQRYATGKTKKIPIDAVKLIADATGSSASWIMGWSKETEKKNDTISDIVLRLRSDDEFRDIVTDLYNASTEQLNVVKAVSSAFKQH